MIVRVVQTVRFVRIALAARTVQDYLLNGPPGRSDRSEPGHARESWEGYLVTLQKRIDKLRVLDRSNPSWRIEARKRLLQLATVCVALMEKLDAESARRCPWCGVGEEECRCSGGRRMRERRGTHA